MCADFNLYLQSTSTHGNLDLVGQLSDLGIFKTHSKETLICHPSYDDLPREEEEKKVKSRKLDHQIRRKLLNGKKTLRLHGLSMSVSQKFNRLRFRWHRHKVKCLLIKRKRQYD